MFERDTKRWGLTQTAVGPVRLLRYALAHLRALLLGDAPRPPAWDAPHDFDPDALDTQHDVCRHCGCSRMAAEQGMRCWGPAA